jgi:hypothetical protein
MDIHDSTPKFDGNQKLMFNFSVRYVHLLREIFTSGEVAKMGAPCFTLWCCLKVHSNFEDGFGFPRAETLAEILEQSLSSTNKQLQRLVKMGYVEKVKKGRKVFWRCTEKFSIEEKVTETTNPTEFPYIPKDFEKTMKTLKKWRSGEIDISAVRAQGVTINYSPQIQYIIQNGNNNKVYQLGADGNVHQEPNLVELLENITSMREALASEATPSNQRVLLETWLPAMEKQAEAIRSKSESLTEKTSKDH